jgi:hypothetical protein
VLYSLSSMMSEWKQLRARYVKITAQNNSPIPPMPSLHLHINPDTINSVPQLHCGGREASSSRAPMNDKSIPLLFEKRQLINLTLVTRSVSQLALEVKGVITKEWNSSEGHGYVVLSYILWNVGISLLTLERARPLLPIDQFILTTDCKTSDRFLCMFSIASVRFVVVVNL